MKKQQKPFEVLTTGTHKDNQGRQLKIGMDMLKQIVQDYKPSLSETPIVIGHPETHHPAFGWIKKFSLKENKLLAHPTKLAEDFCQAVRDGHYRKVSMSLYAPEHPHNPKPGGWYPRHIGFLGAAAPAMKGLNLVEFVDDEDGTILLSHDFSEAEEAPQKITQEETLQKLGKYPLKNLLKGLKLFFHEKKLELPDNFLDDLVQSGDLLPAQKTIYLEILNDFIGQFSEANQQQQQYEALHHLLLTLIQTSLKQQDNKAPEFSETSMTQMVTNDFYHQHAHQDARLIGYQLGNEARKFLAQQRANGHVATIVEAIQHAKETMRRVT